MAIFTISNIKIAKIKIISSKDSIGFNATFFSSHHKDIKERFLAVILIVVGFVTLRP